MTNASSLSLYVRDAISMGYRFECPCGELLRSVAAARTCRKCRKYSHFPGRYVLDAATGEVVYGTLPSDAEVQTARARALSREAAEEAFWAAERAREEAEALEAAVAAREAEVEAAYWAEFFKYEEIAESLGF